MEQEIFNELKSEVTDLGKSVGKVGELHAIGIISRVLGLFLLIFTVVLLIFALLSFGAVAAIDALSAVMPVWAGALIVGGVYLLLLCIAIACRKALFVHPFISLLSKQIKTEEELEKKTMEAEHQAELKCVKMQFKVENATRELDFYANIISRIWGAIKKKIIG